MLIDVLGDCKDCLDVLLAWALLNEVEGLCELSLGKLIRDADRALEDDERVVLPP